jgi:hypothetical protein
MLRRLPESGHGRCEDAHQDSAIQNAFHDVLLPIESFKRSQRIE